MTLKIWCSFLLAIMAMPTQAYVVGGSNLSLYQYDSCNCQKPFRPTKPFSLTKQWEVDNWNSQVDIYNSQYQFYIKCVKTYLENAENDIQRIKEGMDEAVRKAKADY